jgi:hypothetical protein
VFYYSVVPLPLSFCMLDSGCHTIYHMLKSLHIIELLHVNMFDLILICTGYVLRLCIILYYQQVLVLIIL